MKKQTALLFLLSIQVFAVAQLSMKKIAELPEKMAETSGLVLYNQKYLITHNDGGNKAELFVLDLEGNHIKTIEIENTKNQDWEDIALDTDGHIYIGDFGNNLNKREACHIYILPKNLEDKEKVEPKKITFTYEDQEEFPPSAEDLNYDCEAFFWKDDSLYLFTKCRSKPFTGISNIYVLPAKEGKYKARKIGSFNLCNLGWQFCSVTAVDYFAKSNTIALLTYSRLYLISGFDKNQFWNGQLKSYNLGALKQREAICFKSKNSWYMTDEYRKGLGGGNLYELTLKK